MRSIPNRALAACDHPRVERSTATVPSVARRGRRTRLILLATSSLLAAGLVAATPQTVSASTELAYNGQFGQGTAGWINGDTTDLEVSGAGHESTHSAQLTARTTGTIGIRTAAAQASSIRFVAGDRFVATAWVRSSDPDQRGSLILRAENEDGYLKWTATPFTLPDTGWHQIRTVLTAPADGTWLRTYARFYGVPTGHSMYVDDISLLKQPSPTLSQALAGTKLLSDDFDALPLGAVTPQGFISAVGGTVTSRQLYDDTSVVSDGTGGGALRTTLVGGTVLSIPEGNNGMNTFVKLPHPVESACISYDIKFDKYFDWSLGGKLPGLLGVEPGLPPSLPTGGNNVGNHGWSGRLMWLGPGAFSHVLPRSNEIASYMYYPEQSGDYGENVWWNTGFVAGQWHHITQCHTMNTPDRADGVLRAWIDGRLVVNRTDFVYREDTDVAITHLAWSIFRGGHTLEWAGDRTNTIDIDNLKVTTP